jgi:hypothetical protein
VIVVVVWWSRWIVGVVTWWVWCVTLWVLWSGFVGCGLAVLRVAVVGWVWVSGLVCLLVVAMRGVAAVVGVYECVRWCAVAVGALWSSIFIP